ncbi:MAG: class I SAM-dependent methyltransferase [Bacillota bacterium]
MTKFKLEAKFDQFVSQLTDQQYLDILIKSMNRNKYNGINMPGLPDENIQKQFVGNANEIALRGGFKFYQCVKRYAKVLGRPLGKDSKVLDFGCGWGRIIRFFFKDVADQNLLGVDVDPKMISLCNDLLGKGKYKVVNPQPPVHSIDDNSLDIIFAFSVFSHLAEDTAEKWIKEFSRILRPGGIVVATTEGLNFLQYCQRLRERPELVKTGWHKALKESFKDINSMISNYNRGIFLYSATGGGDIRDKSFYGEAVIPKAYIERVYGKHLKFIDFFEDTKRLPQPLFVLQKKE